MAFSVFEWLADFVGFVCCLSSFARLNILSDTAEILVIVLLASL